MVSPIQLPLSRSSRGSPADEIYILTALFFLQMDLIAHRNSQAVSKLQQAVALESSAACATLGKYARARSLVLNRVYANLSSRTASSLEVCEVTHTRTPSPLSTLLQASPATLLKG